MNKIQEIIDLEIEISLNEGNTLAAAFCYCLSPEESIELLLGVYRNRLDLRNNALRKVCDDLANSFDDCHKYLVNKLLSEFDSLNAKERQSSGYCLSSLVEVLPTFTKRKTQRFLLKSKYVDVRRRGYKSLSTEKKIPVSHVKNAWDNFKDPECAWLIINKLPVEYLLKNRKALLKRLEEGWRTSRLFIRIGAEHPEVVDELKLSDPISYCYALVKLGLSLSDEEAMAIFDQSMMDERLGLLIWAFGRLGLWNVLSYIKARLPDVERQRINALKAKNGI